MESEINPELKKYFCDKAIVHPYYQIDDYSFHRAQVINSSFEYQKKVVSELRKQKQWSLLLSVYKDFEKPTFLLNNISAIPPSDFFSLVGALWNSGFQTCCFLDNSLSRSPLAEHRRCLMTKNELKNFDGLPKSLTAYRAHDKHNLFGCSWTSEELVAKNFANLFKRKFISRMVFPSTHVVALFERKGESELIAVDWFEKFEVITEKV